MKKFLVITAVFFGIVLFGREADAFELSPVKYFLTIKPGTSQIVSIKLKNTETSAKKFEIGILGVKENEAGKPVFAAHSDEAEEWIVPQIKNIELAAGASKEIKFAVSVPFGARPGAHYVGLTAKESTTGWSNVGVSGELACIVTIQVAGETKENLAIESWNTVSRLMLDRNWNFQAKLRNNGTIDVPMTGAVRVRGWNEDIVYNSPVVLGNSLLAKATRSVKVPIIIAEDNIKWPGIYRVELKIQYGRLGQTLSSVRNVLFLPFWPTVSIILGAIVLVLSIFMLKRKLLKK